MPTVPFRFALCISPTPRTGRSRSVIDFAAGTSIRGAQCSQYKCALVVPSRHLAPRHEQFAPSAGLRSKDFDDRQRIEILHVLGDLAVPQARQDYIAVRIVLP